MHNHGKDAGTTTLACPQELSYEWASDRSWDGRGIPPQGAGGAAAIAAADAAPGAAPSWFALRSTLIDLLRRSFFAVADPWVSFGSLDLPAGGFVRWQWFDEVGAPVHIEINPGMAGPPGVSPAELIERLVMLGWNTPRDSELYCWLEAPRPEMWLRRDQRQRFADTADRIILALTVVLGLAPTDIGGVRVEPPLGLMSADHPDPSR